MTRQTLAEPAAQTEPGREHPEAAPLAPWFHNLHLPDGSQTAPAHPFGDFPAKKWAQAAPHIPEDLTGWRALDLGCNAGYYTFELARRGAEVVGLEPDSHYFGQARWALRQFGLEDRVEFRQDSVYELARMDETFDLVIFMGLFYHLRYPLLALDLVAEKTERLLLFQTLTSPQVGCFGVPEDIQLNERDLMLESAWPRMSFIEHRLAGDPTNWWAPNAAACEALLRSSGMRVICRPGPEMYLCEPGDEFAYDREARREQLMAATGRA